MDKNDKNKPVEKPKIKVDVKAMEAAKQAKEKALLNKETVRK